MSGKVVGWAFDVGLERNLSVTRRFVLVAYADNADEDGKCWPEKPRIVKKTGAGRATVYRAIADLEAEGLLRFSTDEKGRECAFLAVPWVSHSETGQSQSETEESHSEKRTNKGTVNEPSKARPKVGRKTVSEDELTLAAAVVSAFNEIAGTALSVEPHLTPIVGRIRERPQLTAAQHRRIIEAVFAGDHWWKGPPGPRIIYGNAAQFEQSIELARAAAKKRTAPSFDVNAEMERVRREQGLD
jgi:hypothetical protein